MTGIPGFGGGYFTTPVGGGGTPRALIGLRDFDPTNFYERAAPSDLGGNAVAWEAMGVGILDFAEGGGYGQREIMSCVDQFVGPGWMAGVDDVRPIYATTNGVGNRFGVFVGNWMRSMTSKQLVFLHTGFDGADAYLYVNARQFIRATTGGFTVATAPFRLGLNGGTLTNPADGMTILGGAFKSDGVLTVAERLATIRDFLLNNGAIVDAQWTTKWSLEGLTPGAAPAVLADGIGALDLTLNGALTVVEDTYATLVRTQVPGPDSTPVQAQMSGNIRLQVLDSTFVGVETKLGGFAFNGALFAGSTIYCTFQGALTDAGGVAPTFELRLYDMGAPGTPVAGVLRATVPVSVTGSPRRERLVLSVTGAPGVGAGAIFNTERMYEVRGMLLTGDAGDLVEIDWAGIQGG